MILFIFNSRDLLSDTVNYVSIFIAGVFVGGGIFQSMAIRQWPFLKKYLNQKAMKDRIDEIQT